MRFQKSNRTDARIFANEMEFEAQTFRSFLPGRRRRSGVNFHHLGTKVREAADWLMLTHDSVDLPYNIDSGWPVETDLPEPTNGQIVNAALRYAGWLKAVARTERAELPEVVQLLERSQSGTGTGSPYTTVSLSRLVRKWHTPFELEKWLRHAKWRANQILAPYGVKVANADLYTVAEEPGNKRTGKGAFAAAARTLARYTVDGAHYGLCDWHGSFRTRGSRQEIFVKARGLRQAFQADRKVYLAAKALVKADQAVDFRAALQQLDEEFTMDTTDGVEGFVANETNTIQGLSVQAMIACEKKSASFGWFVQNSEGESFHSTLGRPRDAAREAVRAWRRQRAMAAEGLSGFSDAMRHFGLDPERMSILVCIQDSYAAGNCEWGTGNWLREQGLLRRKYMGAPQLAKFWTDYRVRRVIVQAISRVANGALEKVA